MADWNYQPEPEKGPGLEPLADAVPELLVTMEEAERDYRARMLLAENCYLAAMHLAENSYRAASLLAETEFRAVWLRLHPLDGKPTFPPGPAPR